MNQATQWDENLCDSCNQIMDGPDIYVLNQELAIDQLIQK